MAQPDLSEFLKLSNPRTKRCSIPDALDQLDKKDRGAAEAALAEDPMLITNIAISKWFEARGHTVRWQSIASHRRKACACDG